MIGNDFHALIHSRPAMADEIPRISLNYVFCTTRVLLREHLPEERHDKASRTSDYEV